MKHVVVIASTLKGINFAKQSIGCNRLPRRLCLLAMTLAVAACANYNAPSVSGNPAKMSGDTLCFRYASGKDPALGAEIAARGLDCTALLEHDPLLHGGGRELDAAHRMGR